jgi:hypothetical protein
MLAERAGDGTVGQQDRKAPTTAETFLFKGRAQRQVFIFKIIAIAD